MILYVVKQNRFLLNWNVLTSESRIPLLLKSPLGQAGNILKKKKNKTSFLFLALSNLSNKVSPQGKYNIKGCLEYTCLAVHYGLHWLLWSHILNTPLGGSLTLETCHISEKNNTPARSSQFHHLKKYTIWFRFFRKHIMTKQMSKTLTRGEDGFHKQDFHILSPFPTNSHTWLIIPTGLNQCHYHKYF